MSKRKRIRRTSTDDWPTEPEPPQTEGPLVKFPDAKNAKTVPDLLILDPRIPYTGTAETFVTSDVLELAQLAVLKVKKYFQGGTIKLQNSHGLYGDLGGGGALADPEARSCTGPKGQLQALVRQFARKQEAPERGRPSPLWSALLLSSALCQTLKSERAEKSERRPKRDASKTVELTVALKTTITVSSADALAILAGTKQLVVADKAKNEATQLGREG